MGLGAHELVRLHAVREILLDDAGGLVAARRLVGRRPNAVAVVVDGLEPRRLSPLVRASPAADQTAEKPLQRHDLNAPLQAGAVSHAAPPPATRSAACASRSSSEAKRQTSSSVSA